MEPLEVPLRFNALGMRQSGRISLLLVGIVTLVIVGVLLVMVFGKDSPTTVTTRWFNALATGDAKTAAAESYMQDNTQDQLEQKWDRTLNVVAPYYRFRWQVLSESIADDKTAAVNIFIWKDALNPSTYEERYGIPLIKVDGEWKVDLAGVPREMFPGLPR